MPIDSERTELLFQRVQRLLKRLPGHAGRPEDIHLLRTTIRRLETALDVLLPEPDRDARKLLKQLAKVRRRAGEVRDLDVQMFALRSLRIGSDPSRKNQLMDDLGRSRARETKRLLEKLEKPATAKLRRRMDKMHAHLELMAKMNGSAESNAPLVVHEPVRLALGQFASLFRRRTAMTGENLHRLRLECKRIRYTAEMAGETPAAKEVVTELKRMQDAIGSWHDWLVLTQRAERLFRDQGQVPLLAALRNVTRARYSEAVRIVQQGRKHLLRLYRAQAPLKPRPATRVRAARAHAAIA
jgi:CHAD domain-containing protein